MGTQKSQACHEFYTILRAPWYVLTKRILTYSLTPWCRVLLEKLTGLQLVKRFPAIHGTRRFITALTSVRHLSLSWASPIQSIYPHPTSWKSNLILSTHLRLGLPSGLFPSVPPEESSRMWVFHNMNILQVGVVSISPNPKAGGPPLVGCQRLLIQFIRSCPPYRQPEDAPCRGDRDPLHGLTKRIILKNILV